jgi:hypothetical protein
MMMRRLLLVLSAFSLLVGVMLMAACIRGQWRADLLRWQRTDQTTNTWSGVHVVSDTLGISVDWQRYDFQTPGEALAYEKELHAGGSGFFHMTVPPRRNPFGGGSFFNRIGFGYDLHRLTSDWVWLGSSSGTPRPYRGRWHRAHVPYWLLVTGFLGAGVPSVRAFIAWRRRVRRLAAGCCPSCGYDLRTTPERCPECGAEAKPRTAQGAAA